MKKMDTLNIKSEVKTEPDIYIKQEVKKRVEVLEIYPLGSIASQRKVTVSNFSARIPSFGEKNSSFTLAAEKPLERVMSTTSTYSSNRNRETETPKPLTLNLTESGPSVAAAFGNKSGSSFSQPSSTLVHRGVPDAVSSSQGARHFIFFKGPDGISAFPVDYRLTFRPQVQRHKASKEDLENESRMMSRTLEMLKPKSLRVEEENKHDKEREDAEARKLVLDDKAGLQTSVGADGLLASSLIDRENDNPDSSDEDNVWAQARKRNGKGKSKGSRKGVASGGDGEGDNAFGEDGAAGGGLNPCRKGTHPPSGRLDPGKSVVKLIGPYESHCRTDADSCCRLITQKIRFVPARDWARSWDDDWEGDGEVLDGGRPLKPDDAEDWEFEAEFADDDEDLGAEREDQKVDDDPDFLERLGEEEKKEEEEEEDDGQAQDDKPPLLKPGPEEEEDGEEGDNDPASASLSNTQGTGASDEESEGLEEYVPEPPKLVTRPQQPIRPPPIKRKAPEPASIPEPVQPPAVKHRSERQVNMDLPFVREVISLLRNHKAMSFKDIITILLGNKRSPENLALVRNALKETVRRANNGVADMVALKEGLQ
eukprot:CAMPEP_0175046162 /NCGR_PEP_ID=MMETSP0052_2-20121109/4867_1 /TAXON_ID=51329 ORGANISM="Polytomella parva, Strain SAG 63-3" /NCGR_SAMPLE_ID=MMETSP0052_2 /ASSEMBLY_ACC=CAM_ASM_000194 /LENGTH=594 /DNA_ID=CAMNT_0016309857 /DNA_START=40 /DNA_END=1825 /DNA_ORIENTATION=+